VAGGAAQRFVTGEDIAGDWWTLFHSQPLNALIERSLKANPNLKAAQAALLAARENVKAQRGAYYPSVAASFSAARQKTAADIAPVPNNNDLYFNLYTPQVTVSYVPDVFGLNRRTVESLNAQAEQARFAWVASDIALSANVVAAAIQEASLREQIAATHHLIEINTNMLRILRTQFTNGMPTGSRWRRRSPSWRKSLPPCRRCSKNWRSNTTSWPRSPGAFPARVRPRSLSLPACNCQKSCP
jgi:outer membrane protein TolC